MCKCKGKETVAVYFGKLFLELTALHLSKIFTIFVRMQFRKTFKPINIITNPWILALLFALPVIIYFEFTVPKFVSETTFKKRIPIGELYYYYDLDGDEDVELIRTKQNTMAKAAIVIENDNTDETIQINLDGKFLENGSRIIIDDFNADGNKEIFAITHKEAKIYLNSINPLDTSEAIEKSIFIDSIWIRDGKYDFTVGFYEATDMNLDGFNEIIFSIRAGFSIYPRKIYYYDLISDSLHSSIALGAKCGINQIVDIDGDFLPEVLVSNRANNNLMGKYDFPYADEWSWIIVLDHNLDFKFDPILIEGNKYETCVHYVKLDEKKAIIAVIDQGRIKKKSDEKFFILMELNKEGNTKRIQKYKKQGYSSNLLRSPEDELLLFDMNSIWMFDDNLNTNRIYRNSLLEKLIPKHSWYHGTGNYLLLYSYEYGNFYFIDNRFKHIIQIDAERINGKRITVFQIDSIGNNPQFAVQSGNNITKFIIKKNPDYVYRFGYYSVGYLILLVMVFLILLSQRARIREKQRFKELQFYVTMNQLEPHFILNALTSIGNSILKDDKELAYTGFSKFTNLIRSVLSDKESMVISLKNELYLTEDYLKMQKLRFPDRFDFSIQLKEGHDLNILVPKMSIRNFADNALKHGIFTGTKKGEINVEVKKVDERLQVYIADNGIGRRNARGSKTSGTGKGIPMIEQLFDWFNKNHKTKYYFEINDLMDDRQQPQGTRVMIYF